jgi:hypothetical protein
LEVDQVRLIEANEGGHWSPSTKFKGHKMTKLREAEIAKAVENYLFDAGGKASIAQIIPSCAEADSDLGFPNGGKSDSMLLFIWRT